ncbi:MAG: DapH/DapD/GlmU-related protein [Candidatus Freyarchaeota archaeon]|nr:DapH/DapD/GlmU-related protein [Candidatus Freyrarchaeum guaymaensis]
MSSPSLYRVRTSVDAFYTRNKPFGMPGLGSLVLRALGAKMGRGAVASFVADPYLIEMGDGSIAGGGSIISGHVFDRGKLKIGKVKIGKNVVIGGNAVIFPDVEIGDNSVVGALSLVTSGTRIPPNQVWGGIPAKPIMTVDGKLLSNMRESKEET